MKPPAISPRTACDALGDPVRLLFGPGQQNDMAQAHALIGGLAPEAVIADKGYDADPLHDAILDAGAEPVIPPRRHRRRPHTYDRDLYKERNRIERFFAKLKQFRRVATRYDKLLANFRGFVLIAAIAISLVLQPGLCVVVVEVCHDEGDASGCVALGAELR